MAGKEASTERAPSGRGKVAKTRIKHARGASKTAFGSVVVQGPKPSKQLLAHNVKLGSESLKRAAETIARPGVSLKPRKGVPHFFADSERPGFYLRKLDGRIERGHLVDGVFVVVE